MLSAFGAILRSIGLRGEGALGAGDAPLGDRRTGERRARVRDGSTGRRLGSNYRPSALRNFTRDALDTGVQRFDAALLWAVAILLMIGLVMVYSASIAVLERKNPGSTVSTYYLFRHSISIAVALAFAVLAYAMPPRHWQRVALPLFVLGIVLLAVLLIWAFTSFVRGSDGLPLFSITLAPALALRIAAVATLCGVLAAVAPARRAAALDPAQAIRM